MTLPVATAHQDESVVLMVLDLADLAAANTVCTLPAGAIVTGGFLAVTTAYSAACTVDIGDATTANRYANDVNVAATGATALTITGYEVTAANADITLTPSAVDATSPSGAAVLCIRYAVVDREDYSIG